MLLLADKNDVVVVQLELLLVTRVRSKSCQEKADCCQNRLGLLVTSLIRLRQVVRVQLADKEKFGTVREKLVVGLIRSWRKLRRRGWLVKLQKRYRIR